ncbi:Protein patched-like protein 1 [Aphelenchoides besseyi]|nr:Protein patched-like protein 1 [Aphelenchoides besseyi]
MCDRVPKRELNETNDSNVNLIFDSADVSEIDILQIQKLRQITNLRQFVDRNIVNKNDPSQFSETWRQNFMHHPSWCDAGMSLQQIHAGKATGNRIALYARAIFQWMLYHLGCYVQRNPLKTIIVGLLAFLLCCVGLQYVIIETDIVKLWVSQGGRLDEELNYLGKIRSEYHQVHKRSTEMVEPKHKPKPVNATKGHTSAAQAAPEIPSGNGLGGGFQVIIQTPEVKGKNLLNKEGLLRHVHMMEEIAQYKVEMYGENWTLSDICFKPPAPALPPGSLNGAVETLLERIVPCIWITPIDCFWEGSKPLGPNPPLVLGEEITAFISSLPKGQISWQNLNPGKVVKEVSNLLDLGLVQNFFERAGIGSAYLDRPCINPLDPGCPPDSPNYFNRCKAIQKFLVWNNALPETEQYKLEEEIEIKNNAPSQIDFIGEIIGRKKRQAPLHDIPSTPNVTKTRSKNGDEDYYAYEDDKDYETGVKTPAAKADPNIAFCKKFGKSFVQWMDANPSKWKLFLTEDEFPMYPNYGNVLTGGCLGFGKNIMKWPEDLIIGGVKRDNQQVSSASAFQSVFLVAGPSDVFYRFKTSKNNIKPNLDQRHFTMSRANDIIQAWQRNFTSKIYQHPANKQGTRVFHPLASTSIADMLEEFSQFKFFVIFIGYVLMVIYAGYSQMDWQGLWFSSKSCCGLAVIGVLLITYSSIAGLGLATMLGINFNAATTQIVPFLSLGLGIDDMFLVLHNYHGVLESVQQREIGVLMKETGMSILITSTNNILAFATGIILPIPALRSFCSQTAILLMFNLITIMTVFPAFVTLDMRRRKAGKRDLAFGCVNAEPTPPLDQKESSNKLVKNVSIASNVDDTVFTQAEIRATPPTELKWYTLDGFLRLYYIPLLRKPSSKVFILIMCTSMFVFGCVGLYRSKLGLELADVLPENTAPAAFLKAREEYFSFYPMFLVPYGPHIDYPNQQSKLEALRADIAKSSFVIKVNGKPSEPYWMEMMRAWLLSLQSEFDSAMKLGLINQVNGTFNPEDRQVTDDMRLARRLICSYGEKYNCTGRIGVVRLVEEDGTINPEGFYNYLTGWYHVDNMLYYVSQAAFYPVPPAWAFVPKQDALIPPAPQLLYSQIPFYLNNLIDTPIIVEMIKEIRAICDRYTEDGMAAFPTGIAFTFWEQYLHLSWYLFLAIVIIGTAVLLVISVTVFNPWAAAMVAIVVVSMTIELSGFMGLVGVKLNPISAVTLITAVGIGVEFTAHVVLAFLTSLGTRDQRMVSAMEHMFVPVIHGGLSTLLGIVMLAFSEFEFIVVYFFVVMSALVIIGMINGLALLPVLLSLIGPPCEIKPINGGTVLECPGDGDKPPLGMHLKDDFIHGSEDVTKTVKLDKSSSSSSSTESCSEDEHNYHDALPTINEEGNTDQSNDEHKTTKPKSAIQRF